jgi:hypothetical protein
VVVAKVKLRFAFEHTLSHFPSSILTSVPIARAELWRASFIAVVLLSTLN